MGIVRARVQESRAQRIEHILKLFFSHGYPAAQILLLSRRDGDLTDGPVGKAYAALLTLAAAFIAYREHRRLRPLEDVDAVIQTLGVNFAPRFIFEGTTLFSASTRILVDAMKAAGVKRLITVTGLGAGDSRGHGGYDAAHFLLLKRFYDDKDVQEWIIKRSGLDWTIVRPGLLIDAPATGRYRVLTASRDWRAGRISRADVADFLVRQVDDHALIGTTPLLIS